MLLRLFACFMFLTFLYKTNDFIVKQNIIEPIIFLKLISGKFLLLFLF